MKKNIFFFTSFLFLGLSLNAQMYRIQNEKFSEHYLNNETGNMQATAIQQGWWSAQWQLIPVSPDKPEVFVIVNHWTGCALDDQNGVLECSEYKGVSTQTQQWTLSTKDVNGFGSLMNVGSAKYLNEENSQKLLLQNHSESLTARWKIKACEEWEVVSEEKVIVEPTIIKDEDAPSDETEKVNLANPVVLTQMQINDLVNSHNTERGLVSVPNVKWNAKIADFAREWAIHLATEKRCQLKHRQENAYGENIFQGSEIVLNKPSMAVEAWAAEKTRYKGGVIDDNLTAGHYTQVIWGKTTEIGCGFAVCPVTNYVIAVCNYNPPGNYGGESPLDK